MDKDLVAWYDYIEMKQDNFIKQLEKDIRSPEFGSGVDDGKALAHDELEFLDHSNRIEGEYSKEALEDAILAWKYIKRHSHSSVKENYVLTFDSTLHCHYLLMQRLRPDIAGRLRTCDVWIGGKKKVFVSEQLLEDEIRNICKDMNAEFKEVPGYSKRNKQFGEACKEVWAEACHVRFENVHPFEDGNGRTGRIIYNAHRLWLGLPIHVIREGREQREYYKWFSEGRDE